MVALPEMTILAQFNRTLSRCQGAARHCFITTTGEVSWREMERNALIVYSRGAPKVVVGVESGG